MPCTREIVNCEIGEETNVAGLGWHADGELVIEQVPGFRRNTLLRLIVGDNVVEVEVETASLMEAIRKVVTE